MVRSFLLSITLIFLGSIFSGNVHAQGVPTIFLHTDKGAYFPGDTVWFKGYILKEGVLDESIRTLYIDWGNAEGAILEHNPYLVTAGVSPSHFVIPTNYSESVLNLNAYTTIIAKNKEMGYFKSLPILQQNTRKEKVVAGNYFLSIQPESGVLLKGVINKIILHAYDQAGRTVELKGRLLSKNNEELLSFNSNGEGFAEIAMIGTEEEKNIEWYGPDGKMSRMKLPEVQKEGAKLMVSSSKDTVSISLLTAIMQNEVQEGSAEQYTIEARMNRRQLFTQKFNLAQGSRTNLKLPKTDLEGGVLQLFLLDAKGKRIGQRAVMIGEEKLFISPVVAFTKRSKDPKGRNGLSVQLPEGEVGNLSISITDAEVPVDSTHTIVDALLFGSLSKYRMIAPFTYFKNSTTLNRFVQTNSWQTDFSTYDALDSLKDSLLYLKGRILMNEKDRALFNKRQASLRERNLKKKKPVRSVSFGYRALSDSLMRYEEVFPDAEGRFALKDFNFLDSMELRLTQIEESINGIRFSVDYGFATVPKPERLTFPSFEEGRNETHTFPDKIWDYNPRYFKDQNGITTLREVRIKTRRNYRLDKLDKNYAQGWFSREGVASLDLQNDTNLIDIYTGKALIRYLKIKYPVINKIRPVYVVNGMMSPRDMNGSTIRRSDPFGEDALCELVDSLGLNRVAYIKVFESYPFNTYGGGAIAFYITGPNGANKRLGRRIDLQTVGGYVGIIPFWNRIYSAEEQKNPFQDDDRLTLYWNPMFLIKNKEEKLEFSNNSMPRGYWVTIQGVTDSGKLVYYQKLIKKEDI